MPEGGMPGMATVAELKTAAAAHLRGGLRADEVKKLTRAMAKGASWAEASATIVGVEPAALAGWQATVTALAAMNPPFYPGVE